MGWLRVLTSRLLISCARRTTPESPEDDLLSRCATPGDSTEMTLIKNVYRPKIRAALGDALSGLTERERAILEYEANGLSSQRLAQVFGVHQRSIQRWIDAAHLALLSRFRKALSEQLTSTLSDADSILRLARSEVVHSCASLLKTASAVKAS